MVAILDQYGNPIKREQLTEPQTARVGALHSEFDAHPVRGLTPSKLAGILELAEQGDLVAQADLFEDMEEKDGHILAEMGKRKRALLTIDWDIVPPRNASKQEEDAAAYAKEIMQDYADFEDLLLDLLDAIGKAYSCAEIQWQRDGKELLPVSITHRPARWFTLDRETRSQIRLRKTDLIDGEPLNPFGWLVHTHKAKSGYLARAGLGRVLIWPFLFKNYSVRDLAEFLEIYGLPLRLGTYPNGATDDEKSTLLRAVVNIGHAAAGIIPEGMMIDFKEAAKGGSDPFDAMIAWCERTQSKAILGGTLTSQADGKSSTNALGNVHNEVRWDLTVSDARQLAGTITRDLIFPILALNRGVDSLRRCPRFVFDTSEPEDLKLYSEAVPKLVDLGMRIPAKWAHDKLRIPKAEEDEEVLSKPKAPAPAALKGLLQGAALAAKTGTGNTDAVESQLDRLQQEADAAIQDWVEQARSLVDEVGSLEELRDRLIELYPQMNAEQFSQVMGDALAAAHLAGRYDILEGA